MQSIYPSYLISDRFTTHTQWGLGPNNTLLNYYIHEDEGERTGQDGYAYTSAGSSAEDQSFIDSVFARLDPLIDIDFERNDNNEGTILDIYSVYSHQDWANDTAGEVRDHDTESLSYWDVFWKESNNDASLSTFEKYIIIHEIGHSLGLSHPLEQPRHPAWNSSDTVMSYNYDEATWDGWYSETDLEALQTIWGEESDFGGNGFQLIKQSLGSSSNDKIRGTRNNDDLYGEDGDDKLIGKRGDDWIYPGSSGQRGDIIKTGPGHDRVIADPNGYAIIMDFEIGKDEIDVIDLPQKLFYEFDNGWTYISDRKDNYYIEIKGEIEFFIEDRFLF